ncbi:MULTISPECIES: MFS transporter [Catenuloplanes]|uniref:MFS family permease n=1 Tax=Catenuloplanes niger TaxID=587534 RepID=A0AAE3ZXV9_9ACTN|nr:MFS transporter [Catenuloplanes niger]MDR7326840.1 MFS family permease [Catenuloplanes niger]
MKRASGAYLASYVLSLLGNSVAGVALPLIVLQTTGSVLATGAVAIASALPAAVAGLLMGVVIDRINRRTASVLTDLVSAASIAALPLLDSAVGLSLGWFVLSAVIGSFGDVPGLTAREAMLPGIVRSGGLGTERLLGLREASGAVVTLIGPGVAGVLVTTFDGTGVLWVTAALSGAAALVTLLIPREAGALATTGPLGAPTPTGPVGAGPGRVRLRDGWRVRLRDGWRVLIGSPFLVVTTVLSTVLVLVLSAFQALVLPVYFTLAGRPELLGFVLSALALGLLAGGGTYAAVGGRGPRRAWFVVGALCTVAGFGGMASLASPWLVLAAAGVVGLGNGLFGSLLGVLMVERIPDGMRGRIMGTQNAIMTLAPALGMGAAAVLTEWSGARTAAVALAVAWAVTAAYALWAPALRTLRPAGPPATRAPRPDQPARQPDLPDQPERQDGQPDQAERWPGQRERVPERREQEPERREQEPGELVG